MGRTPDSQPDPLKVNDLVWAGGKPSLPGIVRDVLTKNEYIVTTNYWNIYFHTARYSRDELRRRNTGNLSTNIVSYAL